MVFDGLLFKKIYMEKLFGVLVAGVILVHNAKAQSAVSGSSRDDAPRYLTSTTDKVTLAQRNYNASKSINGRVIRDLKKSSKGIQSYDEEVTS
jgi:hypothetical protein